MTGIEPDEILDSEEWLERQGGQSYLNGLANTFGMLGGLAYGLSDKDGLVPKPGEMKKWFNRACIGYSMLFFGPFLIALAVTLVIVITNVLGGDHNAMWHSVCDAFNADGGWCPEVTPAG